MKVQAIALLAWTVASTQAFTVPRSRFVLYSRLQASNEFEYLLNEDGGNLISLGQRSRRVVSQGSEKNSLQISSVAAAINTEEEVDEEYAMSDADEEDMVAQSTSGEFEGDTKLVSFQESQGTNKFSKWLSQADFQEVVWTLFVPSLLAFAGLKWGLGKVNTNLSAKAETMLESFANEMIYHDGNNEEMSL
ncbi:hypothetical protein MHU86_9904 [Fragilaria crotonensis]|nr:hypothetical protein MHU86_9904 [Fragilaria crotonensis]